MARIPSRRPDRDESGPTAPTIGPGDGDASHGGLRTGRLDGVRRGADAVALLLLLLVVAVAWASANGIRGAASWSVPAAYPVAGDDDPEKSDVLGMLCYMKASAEGHVLPLVWKSIPELGAPFEANWNDFPTLDEIPFFVDAMLGKAFGLFAGLNLGMLIGHLLSATSFYLVARASAGTVLWSFVGGLAFGLAPFAFQHEPHHMQVAWTWPIPLFLPVWRWISSEEGIHPGSNRWWWAVAVGFIAGLHHVYYTNILCQLTLVTALVAARRGRTLAPLLPAAAVIAAAAAAFVLMNVDTWTYRMLHGPNGGALVRDYQWLELYGLKIKDLFIPPLDHRSSTLAEFSRLHRAAAPLLDERASYQGLFGLACLAWLVGCAVMAMIDRRERDVPPEAWQLLWIVLVFTTGGVNAILGTAGLTLFRSGCRASIVVLAISLLWGVGRLSALQRRGAAAGDGDGGALGIWVALAAAVCLVVVWDEVPRPPTQEQTAKVVRQVASDRAFVERMEEALPEGAMVFQLPIMEFPESPAPGVPPYDHFRPYLYSRSLRYSFGSMKGRPREAWQRELGNKPLEEAVGEIVKRGFAALYVNRRGFPDRAQPIEQALRRMGYTKPAIVSDTGDLVCIILEKP